ncbi:MAG: BON domain-containing protein [Bacteroidota bacterium]
MSISPQVLGYGLPPVIRSIVDRYQSQRARTTADQSVARRLRDSFRANGIQLSGLTFYVHDGAVSIYGSLTDGQAREDVISVASAQPGVRRIVDHLRLTETPLAA